jgi:hypothetical protein
MANADQVGAARLALEESTGRTDRPSADTEDTSCYRIKLAGLTDNALYRSMKNDSAARVLSERAEKADELCESEGGSRADQ